VNAFILLDGKDGDDVRMVESGNCLGFTLEAVTTLLRGQLRREDLESYIPVELGVFGDIDFTHAAATELFEDPVMRKGPAYHDGLPSMRSF
jgi:hypothetical protein